MHLVRHRLAVEDVEADGHHVVRILLREVGDAAEELRGGGIAFLGGGDADLVAAEADRGPVAAVLGQRLGHAGGAGIVDRGAEDEAGAGIGGQPVGRLGQRLLGGAGIEDLRLDAIGGDGAADLLDAVDEAGDALVGGIALAGVDAVEQRDLAAFAEALGVVAGGLAADLAGDVVVGAEEDARSGCQTSMVTTGILAAS